MGEKTDQGAEIAHLKAALQRQERELQAAQRELESFAFSVSHDLRAPLRVMNGFLRIINEDYPERLDDRGRHVLNVIQQSANQMEGLLADLLDYSRVGRARMVKSSIDMNELVCGVFEEATRTTGDRNILLEIPETLPPAFADQTLLRQALMCLFDNAVKFTAHCETAIIKVEGHQTESETTWSIADNGAGFDPQYSDKLFRMFQRLHSQEEYPGNGAGLAIAQRIAHRHGGEIRAEAAPNRGAVFHLSLPAPEEPEPSGILAERPASRSEESDGRT